MMKFKFYRILYLLTAGVILFSSTLSAQQDSGESQELSLDTAVMCETIDNFHPENIGVVFSITNGKVVCYTYFDVVPAETVVYHNWYRKDQLSTSRKLTLKPPRWSAFTEIILREADKGPWRVDIVNEAGKTLQTLRFSITE